MKQLVSTKTGIAAVLDVVTVYDIQPTQDGLEFASPTDFNKWKIDSITMPERLQEFLTDIRLLRRIPLSYLVPDPNLLPPESIRFFHVNQTWIDRVIDGIFSTTNTGTVDFHYSLTTLQMIREAIDPAPGGMTGLLIRSELTRRWPKMIVRAFHETTPVGVDQESTIPVLRAEALSRDIFIALFHGQPHQVHIREPFDGVRFGVEGNQPPYKVDQRNANGIVLNSEEPIILRDATMRTINLEALRTQLAARNQGDSRGIALHLEQRPFVQIFLDSVDETDGSVEPPPNQQVPLRNGRLFTLNFTTHALFHYND